jgi:DNA ligase D-like protein (predicted 3'-phosphoesterase)
MARENYYDFRLEIDGVLVSWAIPRGPEVNPHEQRMARRTEDHPLDEAGSEEATDDDDDGAVVVWDHAPTQTRPATRWLPASAVDTCRFCCTTTSCKADTSLTRVREGEEETWLLLKRHDDEADVGNRPGGWR